MGQHDGHAAAQGGGIPAQLEQIAVEMQDGERVILLGGYIAQRSVFGAQAARACRW